MSDIKDIMNLPKAAEGKQPPLPSTKQKTTPKAPRKPAGMSREVFVLTGGVTPTPPESVPLAPIFPAGAAKEKRKQPLQRVTPWVWKPFSNSARSDGFMLYHWERAPSARPLLLGAQAELKTVDSKPERGAAAELPDTGEEESDTRTSRRGGYGQTGGGGSDYPFAKFNKKVEVPTYTDGEYERHFVDSEWSKEETDQLFQLCRQFDLRFVVVHDRWCGKPRTLEQLKERYYTVARKLLELRTGASAQEHAYFKYPFVRSHEEARKQQAERLYRRSPAQIEEERKLAEEWPRIDAALKKRLKDAKRVARLLASVADLTADMPSPLPAATDADVPASPARARKKRKFEEITAESPAPVPVEAGSPAAVPTTPPPEGAAAGPATPVSVSTPWLRRRGDRGAFVRSSQALAPLTLSVKMSKAVDGVLLELAVGLKPALPTSNVVRAFNELRNLIVVMLDLKTMLKKKDYELAVLRAWRDTLLAAKMGTLDIARDSSTTASATMPTATAAATTTSETTPASVIPSDAGPTPMQVE